MAVNAEPLGKFEQLDTCLKTFLMSGTSVCLTRCGCLLLRMLLALPGPQSTHRALAPSQDRL